MISSFRRSFSLRIPGLSCRLMSSEKEVIPRFTHITQPQHITVPESIAPIVSLTTANAKEKVTAKKREVMKNFQMHEHDVGSSPVQIAILTEKINDLARHFAVHKKDKSGLRGFSAIIQKRKALMRHLKRNDLEAYKKVVVGMNLHAEALKIQKDDSNGRAVKLTRKKSR
eukprot:CAMPEP_0185023344 /NCGR_PEP_ID=MMETSP1103-20130426/6029_1 /TAXON_ID=36769 /ORGANISM="Paraphysomonas bandaiensis, Strain Caron Lab Isolate" /LENGTH=169 /DNA_ID=CAMNT_0027555901 /DNA_START=90 /DNA_END=599 /DNA_ORIENTATION=-